MNTIQTNALNLINQSHQKANEAAHNIATLPVDKNAVSAPEDYDSKSLLAPILQLKESEMETKAGVKLLQTDEEMKQKTLDIFV